MSFVEEIRYEADISDIQAKLDRIEGRHRDLGDTATSQNEKVGGSFARTTAKVGLFAAGLGAAGVGLAARFGPAIANAGAGLDAMDKKAQTVFSGGSLANVEQWAAGISGSLGLTDTATIALAANTADLLKPMGFTAQAAADMATQTNDLAGALSAWTGGQLDAASTSDILTKAYLGEREGLKQLGISIMESDVSARLAKKGQEDLTGSALEQAKALATMELIFEKSTDAQTAWADGSMDAVKANNEARAANARLGEVFNRLLFPAIQRLIPIATRVADWAARNLPNAFRILGEWFGRVGRAVRSVIDFLTPFARWMIDNRETVITFAAVLGVFATALGALMIVRQVTAAITLFNAVLAANPIILIAIAIAALVAALVHAYNNVESFRNIVDTVARFAAEAWGWVVDAVTVVWEWLKKLWDRTEGLRSFLVGAVKTGLEIYIGVWTAVWEVLQTVFNWLQDVWDRTEGLRSFIAGAVTTAIETYIGVWTRVWQVLETVFDWLQKVWDRTENFRGFLADVVIAVVEDVAAGFDEIWGALETLWGWLQDVWDRTDTLRDLFENALDTAIGIAVSAFETFWGVLETVFGWLDSIISKAQTAIDFLDRVNPFSGGDVSGGIAPDAGQRGGNRPRGVFLTDAEAAAGTLFVGSSLSTAPPTVAAGGGTVVNNRSYHMTHYGNDPDFPRYVRDKVRELEELEA